MEFRCLELKKLGGDFIEKPDRVLPCVLLLFSKVYPPPGLPLWGAVRGLSSISSGNRGTVGAAAFVHATDCRLEASLFERDR